MYEYKAVVVSVYDGDTIRVDLDLGLGVWVRNESIRLAGINAPEVRGSDKSKGEESRDFLRNLILNKEITIKTFKDKKGKYGRYIGYIYVDNNGGPQYSVNDHMVDAGFAVYKEY